MTRSRPITLAAIAAAVALAALAVGASAVRRPPRPRKHGRRPSRSHTLTWGRSSWTRAAGASTC